MTISYILTQYVILSFVPVLRAHYNSQLETLRDETVFKLGVQNSTFLPTIQNTSKQSVFATEQADGLVHIQGFGSAWTAHAVPQGPSVFHCPLVVSKRFLF